VEQNGIFISYDKRKELANAIRGIIGYQVENISYVFDNYRHELIRLPEYLYPLLPKNRKVPINDYYVLSDRIRELSDVYGDGYSSTRDTRILYTYSNRIADAVEKYNSAKAEIIREIPSFDWTRWIYDIKLEHGKLRYRQRLKEPFDDFDFTVEYVPYEQLKGTFLSEILGEGGEISELEEINRLLYRNEYNGSPVLSIYGMKKSYAGLWEPSICSIGVSSGIKCIYEVSLELYPVADKLIEILKDMKTGLDIYKQEFKKRTKRLEDIKSMYEFKESVRKFKK